MKNSLIIVGKFQNVVDYLKECEKEYTYIKELIEVLNVNNFKGSASK